MKKSVALLKMLSAMLAVLAVAGVVWYLMPSRERNFQEIVSVQDAGEDMTDVESTVGVEETSVTGPETEESAEKPYSQEDIEKLEMKLKMMEEKEADVLSALEVWRSLPDSLTEEQIHTIAKSRVLQYYEENVVLAVEAKTILMDSLGVPVPQYHAEEDAMAEYGDYLKDEITGGLIGQVGSKGVQDAVRYGLDGALDAYEADGTLESALNGAVDSVVEGVVSDIQEYPYELAKDALNNVTGGLFSVAEGLASSDSPEDFLNHLAEDGSNGLIGSVAGAITYEGSPTALFQSMSDSVSASAVELGAFLEKDAINSTDIANMMYQYSQYGEVLHDLNGYDWSGNYSNMQNVYSRFVQNEVAIDFLSQIIGESTGDATVGAREAVGDGNDEEEKSVQAVETSEEENTASLTQRGRALEERIAEIEGSLPALQDELAELKESKFALMDRYAEQLKSVKEDYQGLRNFTVKNFEPQYDVGGSKIIEDNKKINNAIGQLSRYTPWGITLGLFSSMAMEDGNRDYSAMVAANDAFGTGMQTIIVDAKAEIEKFNGQIIFYDGLIEENVGSRILSRSDDEWLREVCENQYLLQYVLDGEDINLDSYALEVRKKLYIMAQEVSLIRDFYATLLTSCDAKTDSLTKLDNQYQEIMAASDPEGTGEIAEMVTREQLGSYMIPLIDAGRKAEDKMSKVGATSPLVKSNSAYSEYGKVYWYNKSGTMKWEGGGFTVYYAGGLPVYIGGLYYYQGILLNKDENADGTVIYEASKNLLGLSGIHLSDESEKNIYEIQNRLREIQ